MEAYCLKCRSKREMKDIKNIVMKNGRKAAKGLCPQCGTKIIRIMKKEINTSLLVTVDTPKAIMTL